MTDTPSGPAQSVTAGPAIFIVNLRDNFLTERPQHACLEGICYLPSVICHSARRVGERFPTDRKLLLLDKLVDVFLVDYFHRKED